MATIEVRINREVRDYQESIFFGLPLRQLVFALLAAGGRAVIAVVLVLCMVGKRSW